jgi:hypothetical protein
LAAVPWGEAAGAFAIDDDYQASRGLDAACAARSSRAPRSARQRPSICRLTVTNCLHQARQPRVAWGSGPKWPQSLLCACAVLPGAAFVRSCVRMKEDDEQVRPVPSVVVENANGARCRSRSTWPTRDALTLRARLTAISCSSRGRGRRSTRRTWPPACSLPHPWWRASNGPDLTRSGARRRLAYSPRAGTSCRCRGGSGTTPPGFTRDTYVHKYVPGRRSAAWLKHKLRREEQLAVTGARRSRDGWLKALFVARPGPDGSFASAGSIELGLRDDLVEALERQLASKPARRRGAVT